LLDNRELLSVKRAMKSFAGFFGHAVVLILALAAGNAHAERFHCAGLASIEVTAPDDRLLEDICTASDKAISFLAKYQLHPSRVIKIQIIETAIDHHGYLAYGSYDRQSDLIQLVSLPSILTNIPAPQMYDQPFDREHYHGAIAHEIAHAVFQHNTGEIKEQLTNAAQEYLAHATQLGVLSAERRHAIIKAGKVGPWQAGDSIGVTYMGLNPTGFAVKSYLHLTQMVDPQPFIEHLLQHNWFFISVP
jgi:hypothetical protein